MKGLLLKEILGIKSFLKMYLFIIAVCIIPVAVSQNCLLYTSTVGKRENRSANISASRARQSRVRWYFGGSRSVWKGRLFWHGELPR